MVVPGDDLPVIGGAVGECSRVICFGGEGGKGARGWVCGSHIEVVVGAVTGVGIATGPGEGGGNGGGNGGGKGGGKK